MPKVIRKLRLLRAAQLLKVALMNLYLYTYGAGKNPALEIKAEFVSFEIKKKKKKRRGAENPQANFSTENS